MTMARERIYGGDLYDISLAAGWQDQDVVTVYGIDDAPGEVAEHGKIQGFLQITWDTRHGGEAVEITQGARLIMGAPGEADSYPEVDLSAIGPLALHFDWPSMNRLIAVQRRARDGAYGKPE
jgi:hypothetical protein